VYEERLAGREWLAGGGYSIADIAAFPWLRSYGELGIPLSDYPAVMAWIARIEVRPAVQRGLVDAVPPAQAVRAA
jgi:GST-like protein